MNITNLKRLCYNVYIKRLENEQFLNQVIAECKALLEEKRIKKIAINVKYALDIKINLKIRQTLELMGYCYYKLKNLDEALKIYQILVKIDKSVFCAHRLSIPKENVDIYYEDLRSSKERISKLRQLLKDSPAEKKEIYEELAWMYFSLGYYKLSLVYFKQYLQEDPINFEYWEMLAEHYENEGKFKKAIQCYESAEKCANLREYEKEAKIIRDKIEELRDL